MSGAKSNWVHIQWILSGILLFCWEQQKERAAYTTSIGVDVQTYSDECLLVHFHFSLGKLSKTPEGLCKEVGIHLSASRSTSKVGELNRDLCKEKKISGIWRWCGCVIAKVGFPSTADQLWLVTIISHKSS